MDATTEQSIKRPGRKSETPAEKLARLERDLQAAKRAVKDAERRAFATIGEAMLAEAESDADFNARMRDILRRRVTSKTGLADIATVLAG